MHVRASGALRMARGGGGEWECAAALRASGVQV